MSGHVIAITGSRMPNPNALATLSEFLAAEAKSRDGVRALHHGACVGVDEFAHRTAVRLGIPVVIHPPDNPRHRMALPPESTTIRVLEPLPYLTRNRRIVDAATRLVAVPNGVERLRSGTWATVRYARSLGKPIDILHPNGGWELEGGEEWTLSAKSASGTSEC